MWAGQFEVELSRAIMSKIDGENLCSTCQNFITKFPSKFSRFRFKLSIKNFRPAPLMEPDNSLLIIEENEIEKATKESEENPAAKLKLALANKKLKEDFFKENEINKTAEIINDDFENEIDQSILQMEQSVGAEYESDDSAKLNDSDEDEAVTAKNSQLIESSVLQRRLYEDYHHHPYFERRRLSECIEESESDEEPAPAPAQSTRFTVTKAPEEVKVPVSILKKTPSPPSNQKMLVTHSPKKIRYEASALKHVSAAKNSQTIHFPCSPEKANVKSIFSPQGFLNPHLSPRFFDTSLVEVRASQTLTTSSKSLDDKGSRQLDDNVWIKRAGGEVKSSCDSVEKVGRVSR